jgi:hypothetical protein
MLLFTDGDIERNAVLIIVSGIKKISGAGYNK